MYAPTIQKKYCSSVEDFDKIIHAALGSGQEASTSYPPVMISKSEHDDDENKTPESIQQQNQNARTFSEIEGVLWCKLADYYICLGEFEVARSIYERAMNSVTRVRDFSLVFDAYSHFEEGAITTHLALLEEEEAQEDNIMRT
jgi:hypothetical protein